MFERFTERSRNVVVLAQEEAVLLRHNYIGTEHLLLGLLREEDGLGARVLETFDVTLEEVRAQVARVVAQGTEAVGGQVPFTPSCSDSSARTRASARASCRISSAWCPARASGKPARSVRS